ncbi:hypothetical protein CYG48_09020 [Neorhizobium sp. SOG26]|nr:hypothetical protein CYG48_09020 [Neorhizobium sp. SOG26]
MEGIKAEDARETRQDHRPKRTRAFGGGIAASVLLHVVLAFAFFFHFPLEFPEPPKEESVTVELVPPPEEPEEEAEKAEEPPPPEQEEEAKQEEPPPPPPPPPPQEEAKQEEPPPPPEPSPPPPPAPEPPQGEERAGQPMPVMRPVQQFGEKDEGPRVSEDGDAPEEPAGREPETAPTETEETSKAAEETEAAEDAPPASAVPDDVNVPEVDTAASSHVEGPETGAAPAGEMTALIPQVVPAPTPKPTEAPAKDAPSNLTKATKLFSRSVTESDVAMAAMGDIPREIRAGQLCATELREQLRHAPAAYRPDILPAYKLPSGTVLEVKQAAFRASAQWYNIRFRCEVDEDAMKVVSFAFDVGAAVPRSQWRARGFPD